MSRQIRPFTAVLFLLPAVLSLVGCDPSAPTEVSGSDGEVGHLQRPFTAEQIRDEMVPGLVVVLGTKGSGQETRQRWTVTHADADGVDIEYASIDHQGTVLGETRVGRSTWVELRDHATFPASRGARKQVVRETPLGRLEGWLYTMNDEENRVTEVFFASSLPGPPVQMKTTAGGRIEQEMTQLIRQRP